MVTKNRLFLVVEMDEVETPVFASEHVYELAEFFGSKPINLSERMSICRHDHREITYKGRKIIEVILPEKEFKEVTNADS